MSLFICQEQNLVIVVIATITKVLEKSDYLKNKFYLPEDTFRIIKHIQNQIFIQMALSSLSESFGLQLDANPDTNLNSVVREICKILY